MAALDLESPFDRLTALACALFGAPHAMVGVVDGERTLFRATVGLAQDELPCDQSVTAMMVAMGPDAELVVEDALANPATVDHPMVTGEPHLRFFAGVTIQNAAGEAVGAIGVMDTAPRPTPDAGRMDTLRELARLAGEFLDQAERMRRQNERYELLRLAEQMAGVGRWRLDVAGGRVTWSDEVYRIHGVDRAGFDPNLGRALDFYHPEDRPVLVEAIERSLREGVGYRLTLRLIRADGEERLVESLADCERGPDGAVAAVFGVFRDVTDEVQSRRRLEASEERYRLLAERGTDVIITYGFDGITRYYSPAIRTLTGYAPEELVGQSVTALIHPDDVAEMIAGFRAFALDRTAEHHTRRYRCLTKTGETRWFETRATVTRDAEGRAVEFQDTVRDVTETKRLEDELIEAKERAEAVAQAKSEFLANMSHELRTPLTSVIGFSGLLRDSATLGETERRHVERIATASEALLGVINDILDYSKLEADRVDLDPRPLQPGAMARAAASIVEDQCRAKGLDVAVTEVGTLPDWVMGDEVRLRQVTLNFLSNALKFTAKGRIEVRVGHAGERLRVEVEDTGIGVPADKLARLFDRFTQADASTTRLYGGTGLGLAISRRLIEMMGGEVGATSRPGEGSTFWFEVPAPTTEGEVGAPAGADGADLEQGLRVLVADDAPANRELVAAILSGLGATVETVCDGAEAVQAVRAGAPDLVLMDVHMPNMDGLDACRAIRALPGPEARTPILALTANVQPEQVRRCLEAGMDGHVGKPIQVPELVAAMAALLEGPADGQEAARRAG